VNAHFKPDAGISIILLFLSQHGLSYIVFDTKQNLHIFST